MIDVDIMANAHQFIHCVVKYNETQEWLFTAMYVRPSENSRAAAWEAMKEISNNNPFPLLVVGYLNDIKDDSEKRGGNNSSSHSCRLFDQRIN